MTQFNIKEQKQIAYARREWLKSINELIMKTCNAAQVEQALKEGTATAYAAMINWYEKNCREIDELNDFLT